jgi:hypothetical protein
VKGEDLASGESEVEIGTLRHNSNQALNRDLFLPDVVVADPGLSRIWPHARGEDADGCGLPCTVWTEETEDFARGDL